MFSLAIYELYSLLFEKHEMHKKKFHYFLCNNSTRSKTDEFILKAFPYLIIHQTNLYSKLKINKLYLVGKYPSTSQFVRLVKQQFNMFLFEIAIKI